MAVHISNVGVEVSISFRHPRAADVPLAVCKHVSFCLRIRSYEATSGDDQHRSTRAVAMAHEMLEGDAAIPLNRSKAIRECGSRVKKNGS